MTREIKTHCVEGLNESISIMVLDEPGPGGANHVYVIACTDPATEHTEDTLIKFQKGPIKEAGVNGLSNEVLLAVVRDRLECFQAGPFACATNDQALLSVVTAMDWLQSRTKERLARGVEGQNIK